MIPKLPHWVLTDIHPAFYDSESKTAVGMVAKLYGKMQELIEDYNNMIDNMNNIIEVFTSTANMSMETFELELRQEFQDFIDVVALKISDQDDDLHDAIDYMRTNLAQTVTNLVTEMKQTGEFSEAIIRAIDDALTVQVNYNRNTEELYITNAIAEVVTYDMNTETLNIKETVYTGKEDVFNKVQNISNESTEEQYPSAKAVYEAINRTVEETLENDIQEALGGEY